MPLHVEHVWPTLDCFVMKVWTAYGGTGRLVRFGGPKIRLVKSTRASRGRLSLQHMASVWPGMAIW